MATIPPNRIISNNLLSTHRALLDTLQSYLTVFVHQILYLRNLYPPISFLSTRAYNYPVRQQRHPEVCTWINDAILAVRDQLERNTVHSISVVIFETQRNRVLERWTTELIGFPTVARRDRDVPFEIEGATTTTTTEDGELRRSVNIADLEASFRANLSRLATVAGKLRPVPDGKHGAPECSFTLTVEVKDGTDRPVGRRSKYERAFVVAEPDVFDGTDEDEDENDNCQDGKESGREARRQAKARVREKSRTHAVRRLEAGELRLETYIEEAADVKANYTGTWKTTAEKVKELSYGAGDEKFDPANEHFNPEEGYEQEVDIHRKMGGGANYTKG